MPRTHARTQTLHLTKNALNPALLHQTLVAVLGEVFAGISAGPGGALRIHLLPPEGSPLDAAALAQLADEAAALVAAHDASGRTATQRADDQRAALLEALQAAGRQPWAAWSAEDKDALLCLLAAQLDLLPATGGP